MGWASEVNTPTNVGSSFRVLVSVPDTLFFNANDLIFMAAFLSLETTSPHLGQTHSLSDSFNSLFTAPQLEQVFDDGSNLPITSHPRSDGWVLRPYFIKLFEKQPTGYFL